MKKIKKKKKYYDETRIVNFILVNEKEVKKLYTDDECVKMCTDRTCHCFDCTWQICSYCGLPRESEILEQFSGIIIKYGRKVLWDYCNRRCDESKRLNVNSPDYYGFFGKEYKVDEGEKKHLYTDEECLFACLNKTTYINEVRESVHLDVYSEILNRYGRKLLWNYCNRRYDKKLETYSSDYYGFFGKEYNPDEVEQEHLYTDEECIIACFSLYYEEDLKKLDTYANILEKHGRETLWEVVNQQNLLIKKIEPNSPDYYGFFGKKI